MRLRLTSIQRFSVHDGPGIRTTIFTKGCGIRCPWCANPENLVRGFQRYVTADGANGCYGEDYDIDRLLEICLRDRNFYGDDGGVTASGGEALLQSEPLASLFCGLKREGVGCCVETSLYVPRANLQMVLEYLDYIFVDMKVLDASEAVKILGGDLELYERNIRYLFSVFPRERVCVRVPLVDGMTFTERNIELIGEWLRELAPRRCEIFSVHNLGAPKYASLDMPYRDFRKLTDSELSGVQEYFQSMAVGTEVVVN